MAAGLSTASDSISHEALPANPAVSIVYPETSDSIWPPRGGLTFPSASPDCATLMIDSSGTKGRPERGAGPTRRWRTRVSGARDPPDPPRVDPGRPGSRLPAPQDAAGQSQGGEAGSSCISAPTPCCADLETANARSRLDAVLQGLLERSDGEREQMDEDPGKPPSDPLGKDSSPTAAGKRPSARFSHHRRKKRKETDDGLTEGGQQRQNTYVIKLFDRSVDLAQFPEAAPLYPVCRAWMRNSPGLRDRDPEHSPSPGPGSGLPPLPEDDEGPEGPPGHGADVYKLPPPFPLPEGAPGLPTRSRVPSPLGPDIAASRPDTPPDPVPSTSALIYKNMERWKKIRQRWKEASHRNQLRYAESMKILKEMYERQ